MALPHPALIADRAEMLVDAENNQDQFRDDAREYESPSRDALNLPLRFCRDNDVQAFVEHEVRNLHPYSQPETTKTAQQIFDAALEQFGSRRCDGLELWLN